MEVKRQPGATWLLAFLGGTVGAVAGAGIFHVLLGRGYYALAMPGALLGLGAGYAIRRQSHLVGAVCGLAASALGVLLEWHYRPFVADGSLAFFLRHLSELREMTWVMIVAGAAFAYWFGRGRPRTATIEPITAVE